MANFFTKAIDFLTPWDRKGEAQRRQVKKKKDEEERRIRATRTNQEPEQQSLDQPLQPLQPKRPTNIFEDLNQNLTLGQNKPGIVPIFNNPTQAAPAPGTVIEPRKQSSAVNEALKRKVNDVGGYYESDRKILQQEVIKGNRGNPNRVAGLTQSLDNRAKELQMSGFKYSKPEQQEYVKNRFRGYKEDKPNLVTEFIKALPNMATAIPRKVVNTLGTALKPDQMNNALAILNQQYKTGQITQGKLEEEYQKLTGDIIGRKLKVTDNGLVRTDIVDNLTDFGKQTVGAGVDTASVLPIGEGAIQGGKFAGMGVRNLIEQALIRNATQAGVFGTADTANDLIQGRGITPASVAINYGAPFILGSTAEIGVGAAGRAAGKDIKTALKELPEYERTAIEADLKNATSTAEARQIVFEATQREANRVKIPVREERNIPVRDEKTIPVREVEGDNLDIPVSVKTPPKPIVRDFAGDAKTAGRMPTPEEIQTRRFNEQPTGRPDRAIEGITPRNSGDPNFVSRAEVDAERTALDDALANKEINKTQHKAANKALDDAQTVQDVPKGKPITVKQIDDIPVTDNTVVPQGLPETPGTVRATTQTSSMVDKTKAVAENQRVYTEASQSEIPVVRDTANEYIINNPKQFNKRQVAAARNQRKLAKAYAKAQEETTAAYTDSKNAIDGRAPSDATNEGFAPTGKFAKGKRGNVYEQASKSAEAERAARATGSVSPEEVLKNAVDHKTQNGAYSPRDVGSIHEMLDSGRVTSEHPLYKQMLDIQKEHGSDWGKAGALMERTNRKVSSGVKMTNDFARKIWGMASDSTKVDTGAFKAVEEANNRFATARDGATEAYNNYTKTLSDSDYNKFLKAQDVADKADIASKRVEQQTAKSLLKDNIDINKKRTLDKMASEADVGKMDYVDSAMLSGTGTMFRNIVNTVPGMIEEGVFGKPAAKIVNKFKDVNVGGGLSRTTGGSLRQGISDFIDKAKFMKKDAGSVFRHPIENAKMYSTLGNEAGDTLIDTTARESLKNNYRNNLKAQGFKGDIEKMSTAMARQDPEGLLHEYQNIARVDAGLGGGNIVKRTKIEIDLANKVSDVISGHRPTAKTDAIAKALVRVTVGFPGAVARATATGLKRLPGGSLYDFAASIKEARAVNAGVESASQLKSALLLKQAIKQTGASAGLAGMFYTIGASGNITGSYPDDPNERDKWKRDGTSENSIKIGGNWYQYPAFLGAWAAPATFWANMGRTNGDVKGSIVETAKAVSDVLPTDQLSQLSDWVNGKSGVTTEKFVSAMGANTAKALTPVGALLGQVAKVFDPTKNDTSSGTTLENFIDKVFSSVPGGDKVVDIPNATTDQGEVIKNPGPFGILTGAASAEQSKGVEQSQQIQQETNDSLSKLDKYGLLDDPNMKGVLKDTGLEAFNKAKAGKQLDESEAKALKAGLVKGVSSEGTDTAYLERGQYDTNLAVLKMKRDLMNSDPTVKPSSLKDIDVAIKRGEIYKEDKIPYEFITAYKDTSLTEWRNMGNPEDDDYNLEMYEKLWAMDEKMANAGVSYKSGSLDKQKYYAKKSRGRGRGRSGSGGRGGKGKTQTDFSFGTLKDGSFAPRVKEYASIDSQSGAVPVIRRTRPNIVHKITSSG